MLASSCEEAQEEREEKLKRRAARMAAKERERAETEMFEECICNPLDQPAAALNQNPPARSNQPPTQPASLPAMQSTIQSDQTRGAKPME